jgi:hypothetical protein
MAFLVWAVVAGFAPLVSAELGAGFEIELEGQLVVTH